MAKTTTRNKATTRSTSSRRKTASAAAKAAAEIPTVSDEQVTEDQAPEMSTEHDAEQSPEQAVADGPMTRRELINRVAEATGVKKPVARQVVDGMLKELGDTLSSGKALNLPPLGKASVRRQKEMPNAEILVLKLRRSRAAAANSEDEAIAPAAE